MNPYYLDRPSLVGVSGGRTSRFMWKRILDAMRETHGFVPAYVVGSFQNTGDEDDRTLDFVRRIEEVYEQRIVWLEYNEIFDIEKYRKKDGTLSTRRRNYNMADPDDWGFKVVTFETASRNGEPFDMMIDYYAQYRKEIKGLPPVLPNVAQRMCTSYLKIKISCRYMESLGYDDYDAVLGIRADEPKRFARMQAANDGNQKRYDNVTPMYHAGVTKKQVQEWSALQSFDLQLDPESDEGNCRDCFLKRPLKLLRFMRKRIVANNGIVPADLMRMVDRERRTGQVFRRDRPDYATLAANAMDDDFVRQFMNDSDDPIIDCYCGTAA